MNKLFTKKMKRFSAAWTCNHHKHIPSFLQYGIMDIKCLERWYTISEEEYCAFCSVEGGQEQIRILRTSSQLKNVLCASQQRVVEELFYRALVYSHQCQFKYSTAKVLLVVIQNELEQLFDLSNGDTDTHSTLLRFQEKVREQTVDAALSLDTIKKMMSFHTDNVLKYSQAYKFLFREYPDEDDLVINVEIHTPAVFLPLSTGVELVQNTQA